MVRPVAVAQHKDYSEDQTVLVVQAGFQIQARAMDPDSGNLEASVFAGYRILQAGFRTAGAAFPAVDFHNLEALVGFHIQPVLAVDSRQIHPLVAAVVLANSIHWAYHADRLNLALRMDTMAQGLGPADHFGAVVAHFVVVEDIQEELVVGTDLRNWLDFAWNFRPAHPTLRRFGDGIPEVSTMAVSYWHARNL